MTAEELKEIEKRVYRSTFQDGLWDIFWGLMILGMGLSPGLKQWGVPKPLFYLAGPVLAAAVLYFGKKRITLPRLDHVQFNADRLHRRSILNRIQLFATILIVVLLILTLTGWLPQHVGVGVRPMLLTLLVTAILWIKAFFLDYPMLYLIGALWGISVPMAEWMYGKVGTPLDGIIVFGLSGTLVVVIGLVRFVRFLRKYPEAGGHHGQ